MATIRRASRAPTRQTPSRRRVKSAPVSGVSKANLSIAAPTTGRDGSIKSNSGQRDSPAVNAQAVSGQRHTRRKHEALALVDDGVRGDAVQPAGQGSVAGEGIGLQLDDHPVTGMHEADVLAQDQGLDDQGLSGRHDGRQRLAGLGDLADGVDGDLLHHAAGRGGQGLQGLALVGAPLEGGDPGPGETPSGSRLRFRDLSWTAPNAKRDGGDGGIRTHGTLLGYAHLANESLRPLGHVSIPLSREAPHIQASRTSQRRSHGFAAAFPVRLNERR